MTVTEARTKIMSLDGATVSVRGWLSDPCGGLECAIFPSPVKRGQDWPKVYLSIAAETYTEAALNENQGREVVLRGEINSDCRGGGYICFDRVPDIIPTSLKPVPST